jgi:hypothetical protein
MFRYELEDLAMRPDQEPLLVEQIHAAAYRNAWRTTLNFEGILVKFVQQFVLMLCGDTFTV